MDHRIIPSICNHSDAAPTATPSVTVEADDPDGMPVLIALDTGSGVPAMAKTWSQTVDGVVVKPYDNAWLFLVYILSVASVAQLVDLLSTLKDISRACVVRGKLLPHANWQRTVRRTRDRDGEPATFASCPRRWFLLDHDKLNPADFPSVTADPQACIAALHERLPEPLRDLACFWAFSSSAGMRPDKLGVHFYFLSEIALDWEDAEAVMLACGADPAMSRPIQPHFTARPIFAPPLTDPLPQRFGSWPGTERVPAAVVKALVDKGYRQMAEAEMAKAKRPRAPRLRPVRAKEAPKETRSNNEVSMAAPTACEPSPEGMIGDDHRNKHLMRLAGFARSRGLDAAGLHALLVTENAAHCAPPLDEARVASMAASYAHYGIDVAFANDWGKAVAIMAGLLRHDACDAAIQAAGTVLLGDAARSSRLLGAIFAMPTWKRDCAEVMPDLVFPEEAQP